MLKSVKSGAKAKEKGGDIVCGECDSHLLHLNPNKGTEEYYCQKCHLSYTEVVK